MTTNALINLIKHVQNLQILYFISTQAPCFDKETGELILTGHVEIEAVIPSNSLQEITEIEEGNFETAKNQKAVNLIKHFNKKEVSYKIGQDGTQILITAKIPVMDKEQYTKIMELLFDDKAELEELLAEIEDDYDDYDPDQDDDR